MGRAPWWIAFSATRWEKTARLWRQIARLRREACAIALGTSRSTMGRAPWWIAFSVTRWEKTARLWRQIARLRREACAIALGTSRSTMGRAPWWIAFSATRWEKNCAPVAPDFNPVRAQAGSAQSLLVLLQGFRRTSFPRMFNRLYHGFGQKLHHVPPFPRAATLFHIRIRCAGEQSLPLTAPELAGLLLDSVHKYAEKRALVDRFVPSDAGPPARASCLCSRQSDVRRDSRLKRYHARVNRVLWQDGVLRSPFARSRWPVARQMA